MGRLELTLAITIVPHIGKLHLPLFLTSLTTEPLIGDIKHPGVENRDPFACMSINTRRGSSVAFKVLSHLQVGASNTLSELEDHYIVHYPFCQRPKLSLRALP